MVAEGQGSKPRYGEARIELETGARSVARFVWSAEARQRGGEKNLGYWITRIEFDRPVQPSHRFFVAAQGEFGDPDVDHPGICASVAWADAQRFKDVSLGLLAASGKILPQTDPCVGRCEIVVNLERPLAPGDALAGAGRCASIQRASDAMLAASPMRLSPILLVKWASKSP
jgi:hypothetical protein